MAASNQNSSKDQVKPASDTVNLTAEELRRISGGAGVGRATPDPTPTTPPPPGNSPTLKPGT